ncbi:phage tail tube protein [Methylobacterium dankookense]|uniref:Phage major tail protein 2 n=1 Tax=Methylobacterium dankookense TaxID=560405 RepID=A0A564G568_9HYPH|nr:phage tail tube protein [Methylobacterium dankookense]GJD58147.1 hypothetical protein IFDJLNFL_4062 [Methylobacterium dankookense]VUF15098.1 hypothetical protein MTDSW087_04831 [Methylobacterium dankookense]
MAKPVTASASKLLVLLESTTTAGTFAAPCGLTTKGINFAAESNDVTVPDCDDPDLPAWTERVIRALSSTINGSGVLALESLDDWQGYFFSGLARNCRVKLDVPAANNGGYFQGRFILTRFGIVGEIGNKIRLDAVELQNDGPVTWVAASA